MSHLPVMIIIWPLIFAFLTPLVDMVSLRYRKHVVITFVVGQLVLVGLLIFGDSGGTTYYPLGGWAPEIGIVMVVDGLSRIFIMLIAVGTSLAMLYSLADIPDKESKYYVLFGILIAGMFGLVLTGDLFNLYVFIELTSLASFPLVAIQREGPAVRAGLRYMIFTVLSSLMVLLSIILVYGALGTLNMEEIGRQLVSIPHELRVLILALWIVGLGLKVAVIPLHSWLPPAHAEAKSPVSALLSGVLIKTGLYMIIRLPLLMSQGKDEMMIQFILINIAAVTIIGGHLLALGQRDVKRVLACSSIAHMGYIVLGLGIGSLLGLVGTLFHALNHMAMKSGAFFSLGQMVKDHYDFDSVQGKGRGAPWMAAVFLICCISLIGLPPLGGFASKWILGMAAVEAGQPIYAGVIALGTFLSGLYYANIFRILLNPDVSVESVKTRWLSAGVVGVTGFLCVVGFFAATWITDLIKIVAIGIL